MPPLRGTGFGGFNEKPDEPYHKAVTANVVHLLKAIERADPSEFSLLRGLIDQRRKMVERELYYERMLAPEPLPPLISNMYALEFLGVEEEPVSIYLRLLSRLDDAAQLLDARIKELNPDPAASDT